MQPQPDEQPASLRSVRQDLARSIRYYESTSFTRRHDLLLRAFGDIVHDYHTLDPFFLRCVTLAPALAPRLRARFYLYEKKTDGFQCVCDSATGLLDPPRLARFATHEVRVMRRIRDELVFPLYPRCGTTQEEIRTEPGARGPYDPDPFYASHSLLGLYGVSPAESLEGEDRLFFQILCRWIGAKLNNRLVARKLRRHLRFLSDLGRDIGHNIIVPNMHLKYLLRQVEKQIEELNECEDRLVDPDCDRAVLARLCREKRQALERSHGELLNHHRQISLFLETLFREQHFNEGHLVLRPTRCFVERDVILPQLELYREKLNRQGIRIDKPTNMYRQEFPLLVDVGLLAQVYANLFSNAIKYTRTVTDHRGQPRKALAYGVEQVEDFTEPGRRGIKFNVFTTGTPLSPEECVRIFEEGERGENSQGISGSGHGLAFIRRVIEIHGGQVGCEPTPEGNNFYFILPLPPEIDAGDTGKHGA